jgi:hypothetical protein
MPSSEDHAGSAVMSIFAAPEARNDAVESVVSLVRFLCGSNPPAVKGDLSNQSFNSAVVNIF